MHDIHALRTHSSAGAARFVGNFRYVQTSPFERAQVLELADKTLVAIGRGQQSEAPPEGQVVAFGDFQIVSRQGGTPTFSAGARIDALRCVAPLGPGQAQPPPLSPEAGGAPLPVAPPESTVDIRAVESSVELERRLAPEAVGDRTLRLRGTYHAEACGPLRMEMRVLAIELSDGGRFRLNPKVQDDALRPLAEVETFEGQPVELVVRPSLPPGAWELISLRRCSGPGPSCHHPTAQRVHPLD
ncbi:hypothetical protein [Enhygromyxa salina]|uniref:Uncharacterized protein n=1 Tax=Enhygromyxa salina TaxID=215803 RepID=A0A2S9Y669_9BACT|nr:hypothetical protein [Enhygromyxa salina]PRQ00501.1 hypothetical protein ENSA7_59950 [Enhygromyxa salina]